MKKLNKLFTLLLALAMVCALAACGGGSGGSGGNNAPKTTKASGDLVTAELPSGWSLITGTEMFKNDTADVICHSENYQTGDPYLQVEEYPQDVDGAKGVLESGNPYGTYAGEKELTNGTWYVAENAATAQIDEKVFMVKGYKCDFSSEEVQTILGSLQWAK